MSGTAPSRSINSILGLPEGRRRPSGARPGVWGRQAPHTDWARLSAESVRLGGDPVPGYFVSSPLLTMAAGAAVPAVGAASAAEAACPPVGTALSSILDGKGGNVPNTVGVGTAANSGRPKWGKRHFLIRQSLRDHLRCWLQAGQSVFFLTLTSAPDSPRELLRKNFEVLRKRIARHYGWEPSVIQYRGVDTNEGHGVLHLLIAAPGELGRYLIDVKLLRSWWEELHGARQINIKLVGSGESDVRRVTGYIVTQYVGGQDALVRMSGSRAYLPLAKLRQEWRRFVFGAAARYLVEVKKPDEAGDDWDEARARRWEWWRVYRVGWDSLLSRGSFSLWGVSYILFCGSIDRV